MRQEALFRDRNVLYNGDNLRILRHRIASESVDLIYLDPPFNSKQDYNILYKERDGSRPTAQIKAFTDTWTWDQAAQAAYRDAIEHGTENVASTMEAFKNALGPTDMLAYLSMMAPRLIELHRVLRPSGSIFLHCDPTASHYLKVLMDAVFGGKNFRNEIVWHYSGWNKRLTRHFERRHDIVLFYGMSKGEHVFNSYTLPWESKEQYVKIRKQKLHIDSKGREYVLSDAGSGKRVRRYIEEAMSYGRPVDDVWDIDKVNNSAKEGVNYPTQKPLALLERIVAAASDEGDTVLDPFCGCGTAIDAAQSLNRKWIGIDITQLAIDVVRDRLQKRYGPEIEEEYALARDPVSVQDALSLAREDKYDFQWWVLDRLGALEAHRKKGADKGVDGRLNFNDDPNAPNKKVVIQVKGGKVGPREVRELRGVLERDKATIAVLVTIKEPTHQMRIEALEAGAYFSKEWERDFDRLQILTVGDIIEDKQIDYPSVDWQSVGGFRRRDIPPERELRRARAPRPRRANRVSAPGPRRDSEWGDPGEPPEPDF